MKVKVYLGAEWNDRLHQKPDRPKLQIEIEPRVGKNSCQL